MKVYIAGPITKGCMHDNVRQAIHAGDLLLAAGHAPYVPHLTHFWNLVSPQHYETWMTLDFQFLGVCDALIRLPGESPGADREVAFAHDRGIPVYYGVDAFLVHHP